MKEVQNEEAVRTWVELGDKDAKEFLKFLGRDDFISDRDEFLQLLKDETLVWLNKNREEPQSENRYDRIHHGGFLGKQLSLLLGWPLKVVLEAGANPKYENMLAMVVGENSYWLNPYALSYKETEKRTGEETLKFFSWLENTELPEFPDEFLPLLEIYSGEIALPKPGGIESEGVIYERLKKELGGELPLQLLKIVEEAKEGFRLSKNFFWVNKGDWGSGWSSVYQLAPESSGSSFLGNHKLVGKQVPKKFLVFGNDGCGGNLSLSFREEDYGAVYYSTYDAPGDSLFMFGGIKFWKLAESFDVFLSELEDNPDEE